MVEILRTNFEQLLPEVESNIQKADFIGEIIEKCAL